MADREQVEKVLAEKVAPRLGMDGGGIELVDLDEEGNVTVRLQGACAGCPGARMTVKMFVERVLKEDLPDVKAVEAI